MGYIRGLFDKKREVKYGTNSVIWGVTFYVSGWYLSVVSRESHIK